MSIYIQYYWPFELQQLQHFHLNLPDIIIDPKSYIGNVGYVNSA